jgi:hypothetical protein
MINKKTGLTVLLASLAAGELLAGTLSIYQSGDVLLCFRNPSAGSDLVVDVGTLSSLTNLAANTRFAISTYTPSQLTSVGTPANGIIGLNGIGWSAFTWTPDDTLFVTRPRASLNTQTLPWYDKSLGSQSGVALRMQNVPPGATNNATYDANNTSMAILEPDSSSTSYGVGQQSYGDVLTGSYKSDFNGTFQGNPENTTPGNFSTGGTVQRSDFYQMTAGGSGFVNGKYLGYFELNTNGAMTYVAYPSTPATFVSISHTNNQTTIYYTTGLYGTYTLRGTNNLSGAQTNWPSVSPLSTGDTATHSITFTDNNTKSFYSITAQ